jgi:hypothetical protein
MSTAPATSTNPFADIPVSDWVRDGASALLLLISLALPWLTTGFGFVGAVGRIEVILVTLLSLFSLAITYLARAGVFPPSITVRTVWVLRLAVNAPYLIVVLVHIVLDIVNSQGLGFAAAFGLAGAVLAAQPREAEVRGLPHRDPVAATWFGITVGFVGLGAVTALLALIFSVTSWSVQATGPAGVLGAVIAVLVNAAAVLVPAIGLLRRSDAWRTVIIGLGAALALIVVIDAIAAYSISPAGLESVHALGYGVVLFLPLAALAASPGTRLAMTPIADLTRWFTATATALVIGAVLAGAKAIGAILALIAVGAGSDRTGSTVVSLILLVVILVATLIGRSFLRSNPAGSRYMVVGIAGGILLLGVLTTAVLAFTSSPGIHVLVLALGVTGIIGYAMLVPKSVREYFETYAGTAAAAPAAAPAAPVAAAAAPAPAAAAVEPEPVAAPAVDATLLQRASDPSTPAAELHALATEHPLLWPAIAANPAAYDALLDWFAASEDPQVQAALRARGR